MKAKHVLVYDVSALPKGKRMIDIKREFEYEGIVMWASQPVDNMSAREIATPPFVINLNGEGVREIKFIDVSENKS